MILHHVSVGVKDVKRAGEFYDAALGALGYRRYWELMPYAIAYGEKGFDFWVQLPYDRKPASAGNGYHVAFNAGTKEAVRDFHAAALAHGGTDDGKPGPRPAYGSDYYGAFVLDLDGNKIEAVLHAEPRAAKAKTSKPVKAKAKKAKTAAKKAAKKPAKKAKRKARKR